MFIPRAYLEELHKFLLLKEVPLLEAFSYTFKKEVPYTLRLSSKRYLYSFLQFSNSHVKLRFSLIHGFEVSF